MKARVRSVRVVKSVNGVIALLGYIVKNIRNNSY